MDCPAPLAVQAEMLSSAITALTVNSSPWIRGDTPRYEIFDRRPSGRRQAAKFMSKVACIGPWTTRSWEQGMIDCTSASGLTYYRLCRQVRDLGHDCVVLAPSLIPKRSDARIKTTDGVRSLWYGSSGGRVDGVWVPDVVHEAVPDLVRAWLRSGRPAPQTPATALFPSAP